MTLENKNSLEAQETPGVQRLKLLSLMADVAETRLGSGDVEEVASMLRSIDMLEDGCTQIKEQPSSSEEEKRLCDEILKKIGSIREKAQNN